MPTYKIASPQQEQYEVWIPPDQQEIRIGRSSKNDIPISDVKLSRFHAAINLIDGDYVLTDLESCNGTYLNKQLLKGPASLRSGDVIHVGESEIVFLADDVEAAPQKLKGMQPSVELLPEEEAQPSTVTAIFRSDELLRKLKETRQAGVQIDKSVSLLSILNQAASALITYRPLNELLELIMKLVFDSIPAERGFLMLHNERTRQLTPEIVWNRMQGGLSFESISISRSITRRVMEEKTSLLIQDTRLDNRFSSQQSIIMQGVLSAMCVPLWDENKVIGLIYVDSRNPVMAFNDDQLKILTSLANVAAIKIENTRLLESAMVKQRMEEELALAGEIQRSLLPAEPPLIEGYELTGYNAPTFQVGGDYYDYILLPTGELGLTVADVSGKGTSASLLMASLRASLISLVETQNSVSDLVPRLNKFICKSGGANRFITFFYGQLHPQKHYFRYCNAGHNPPLLLRQDGSVERLATGGLVLGIFNEAPYQEAEVQMLAGDCLVLFTDGISETTNASDGEFGEQRLIDSMRRHAELPIEGMRNQILTEIRAFRGDGTQDDDMTLVLLRRTA